jgi:hypothetical protein
MSDNLTERLNKILPRIVSDDFLTGSGIGNEIAFYIFDYPPEEELRVREHVRFLLDHIPRQKPGLRFKHVNLFAFVLDHLQRRGYLDKALKKQREEGNAAVEKGLAAMLTGEKLAKAFVDVAQPGSHDLILVSGVGSAYPLVRTNVFLTSLHRFMGQTPLVLFYPGRFDQITFRLFGKLRLSSTLGSAARERKDEHYYRAFRLVP